ncbi:MAG: hypothetical protein ACHQZQ_03680 [SAR324 cluster bacterium]
MNSLKPTRGRNLTQPGLIQAARQIMRDGKLLVIKSRGAALAAVVPLAQYRLTQAIVRKLEDGEDASYTRAALADTDPKSWSSLDDIRKELGLERPT